MRTVTFLSDHTSAPVTEAVAVGALMNKNLVFTEHLEMVQLVLNRATELLVTRRVVHTAVRQWSQMLGFHLGESLQSRDD